MSNYIHFCTKLVCQQNKQKGCHVGNLHHTQPLLTKTVDLISTIQSNHTTPFFLFVCFTLHLAADLTIIYKFSQRLCKVCVKSVNMWFFKYVCS